MPSLRPIIVHHHIFKNAGTSIDFSLRNFFGSRWSPLEGSHPRDIVTKEKFWDFILANPEISAVSSHTLRPVRPTANILPIVFIRHPILRARSVFSFTKKDQAQPNHNEIAKLSFPDYVEWALSSDSCNGGVVIKNYQVIHLSDTSFRGENILDVSASLDDLDQAKCFIQNLPVYGLVEKFNDSILKYENFLGKYFKGINLLNIRLNSMFDFNNDIDNQLKNIQNELGFSAYNKLNDFNVLDLSLYEYAQNNF